MRLTKDTFRPIPNAELTPDLIPLRGASWDDIVLFAATFDAYEHWAEPWDHSDWSDGIPAAEYEEMVRREGQPAETVNRMVTALYNDRVRTGRWTASLMGLRTCLFAYWRGSRFLMDEPEDLSRVFDILDAIRDRVRSGELD